MNAELQPIERRREKGRVAYLGGQAAEDQVADHYDRRGIRVGARRWRGKGGEIDLVARDGDEIVFVEVKRARHHAWAAERVNAAKIGRIMRAAGDYVARHHPEGEPFMRFDVALVDGQGRVEVVENAFP